MGEEKAEDKAPEEKAPEQKPAEGEKPAENAEEKKEEEKPAEPEPEAPPAPEPEPPKPEEPQPIVLKVDMHCAGCARGVRKSITSFKGVEEVKVDMQLNIVTVTGKTVDPLRLRERVQRKSGKKTELLSPIPAPPPPEEKKVEEPPPPKPEPVVVTVVMNVNMHCESCAQQVKRNILKVKGVQTVEPDFRNQTVTVKGTVEPKKLADYIYRKTGKHTQIVAETVETPPEPEKPKEEEPPKAEDPPKAEGEEGEKPKEGEGEAKPEEAAPVAEGEKKEGEGDAEKPKEGEGGEEAKEQPKPEGEETIVIENKYEEWSGPKYVIEHVPAPQLFSDENPNACSIM